MKKKISLFGLMLVMLFTIAAPFAYAISTIDVDTFKEKLEDLDYEVYDYENHATARKNKITIIFEKYDSEKDAKEEFALACEELDEMNDEAEDSIKNSSYSKSNCKKSTKSSKGYIKYSAERKDGDDSIYMIAYRKGDTVVSATGKKEDKDEIIKAMKKLGYYSSNTWIVIVVLVGLVSGVVAVLVVKSKKKTPIMNNGMMNQPQNNAFGGPVNNQPQNDMFGGPVNNQPQNNMFGGPTNNQPQNDMFGGPTNNQPQNDMFGGPTNNQPQDFWNQQVKNNNMFDNQNNQ